MITKEQIEGWYMITDDYHTPAMAQEFKSLALLAVALKPRPIGPDANGKAVLVWYDDGSIEVVDENCFDFQPWTGRVPGVVNPTHFIPLSALAGLMEGK